MAGKTKIAWSEYTWNPATGCTEISTGCKNCYARPLAERMKQDGVKKYRNGFVYTEHPDAVDWPLHKRKPAKIFVNSMSDVFHENATEEFLHKIFYAMEKADWHIFQILTKRPSRMAEFVKTRYPAGVPVNIWLGTSVENQSTIHRIDEIRNIDCKTLFVSFEPLLGLINNVDMTNISWAIIGGESGDNFRPVEVNWIQSLIKTCESQNVSVFFKQYGGIRPKSGGRTINGTTYDGFPEVMI